MKKTFFVGWLFLFCMLISCENNNVAKINGNTKSDSTVKTVTPEIQITRLCDLLQKDPHNKEVWKALGNLYFDTNKPEQAVDAYLKYLEIVPNDPNVLTDLGVMYRRIRNPLKAIECFDAALTVNPTHSQALFNKGVVLYYDLKDVEGAKKSWSKLAKLNPNAMTPNGLTIKELLKSLK
jgi:tetratricopeptide (TPR) repeat protein